MNDRFETIPKFFPAHQALRARFDREARQFAVDVRDRRHFAAWRRRTRAHLRRITGVDTMQPAPLRPRVTESVPCEGYVRHRVEITTEPNVVMPLYLLVPNGLRRGERRPAIICPHGHASAGKNSPVGRTEILAVHDAVEQYNYAYAHRWAQRGFITAAPDARAFGERREPIGQQHEESAYLRSTCIPLNHAAISLGQSLTGMWTFDLIRLVDYLQSRKDVDADRIGCGGLSGGGLQTLWLAALDDRIRAAVVSGYFYGYRDSLLDLNGNCGCNYVPGLWQAVDMGDLGALVAPRPLLIETGDRDPLNGARGIKNVSEQAAITRSAYDLFHASAELVHDVRHGEHRWYGYLAEPWLAERLTR